MINSVRNSVLSILNKNNYGFITPTDFNLYAKLAQIEVFEEFFPMYANWLNRENNRMSFAGFSDVRRIHEEFIESFLDDTTIPDSGDSVFVLPSDSYRLETVTVELPSGEIREVEKVARYELNKLLVNFKLQPVPLFPVYSRFANSVKVYPAQAEINVSYIRYPKDPKWTWRNIANGSPLFDPSQPDYQDFEVPAATETTLVKKILQMAGMSIREIEAVQFGSGLEQRETETKR